MGRVSRYQAQKCCLWNWLIKHSEQDYFRNAYSCYFMFLLTCTKGTARFNAMLVMAKFEVFTATLLKIQVLWDVTPCNLVTGFEGSQCHYLQSQAECWITLFGSWGRYDISETSVNMYKSTRRNVSEYLILVLFIVFLVDVKIVFPVKGLKFSRFCFSDCQFMNFLRCSALINLAFIYWVLKDVSRSNRGSFEV